MPSCSGLFRIVRRRLVLGFIFALSLTYCAYSLLCSERKAFTLDSDLDDIDPMMVNDNNDDMISDDDALAEQYRISGKPQSWQMNVLNEGDNDNVLNVDILAVLNDSDSLNFPCRNSIQGKVLIVDERGIVCARHDVLPNGCCSIKQKLNLKNEEISDVVRRERYSCKTCNVQGCCAIYEYCVSCCLHPAKIKGRKDMVDATRKSHQKVQKEEDAVRVRLRNLDRFQVCLAACRTSSASVRHENTYKDPHSKHCYTLQSPYTYQRHRRDAKSLNNNSDAVVVTPFSVVQLLNPSVSFFHFLNLSNDNLLSLSSNCQSFIFLKYRTSDTSYF